MRIEFTRISTKAAPKLLAEARIVFGDGPLEGLALHGFSIWRGYQEDLPPTVTFPAKPYRDGTSTRYQWFLRSAVEKDTEPVTRLRDQIIRSFQEWSKSQDVPL